MGGMGLHMHTVDDCRHWLCERNVVEGTLNNWCLIKGSDHTFRDNFTDNAQMRRMALHKQPRIEETNTTVADAADWTKPPVAAATVDRAGLEAEYRHLSDGIRSASENRAPKVDVGAHRTVGLLDRFVLGAEIEDDRQPYGFLHVQWSKVSGPGDVSFFGAQTQELDTHIEPGPHKAEIPASNDPSFETCVTLGQQGYEADPNIGGTWASNVDTKGRKFRYVRWWKRQPYDGVVYNLAVFGE
jgi:hypothetical protein